MNKHALFTLCLALSIGVGCASYDPSRIERCPTWADGASASPAPAKYRQRSYAMRGKASWYGKALHGRTTASGERFDMYKMTAAHPNLPFGTIVRVRRRDRAGEVVVRINDRGPHLRGRIVDLSWAAAHELGMVRAGVVPVELEVLRWP